MIFPLILPDGTPFQYVEAVAWSHAADYARARWPGCTVGAAIATAPRIDHTIPAPLTCIEIAAQHVRECEARARREAYREVFDRFRITFVRTCSDDEREFGEWLREHANGP